MDILLEVKAGKRVDHFDMTRETEAKLKRIAEAKGTTLDGVLARTGR